MATLAVSNTFVNATPAVATDVNENFDDIVTFVNAEVIHRDATIAFTAVPTGPSSDPSTSNQLTRKAYVDAADATNAAAIAALISEPHPRAKYTRVSAQALPAADTTVILDTEVYDTIGISNASGVLTLPAGRYLLFAEATVSGAGFTSFQFRSNLGVAQNSVNAFFGVFSNTHWAISNPAYFPSSGTLEIRINGPAQNSTNVTVEIVKM